MEKRKRKVIEKDMIIVAIGSNLSSKTYGLPENNCFECLKILKKVFFVKKISKFYKSEPIPKSDQKWYVNGVIEICTTLYPRDILNKLFLIENYFKRTRKIKNEPRVIDLDLISYKNKSIKNKSLTVPHPRMHQRKFVIRPICDLDPNWRHPVLKIKANVLLKSVANQKILNINN